MDKNSYYEKQFYKFIKEEYPDVKEIKFYFYYHDHDGLVEDKDDPPFHFSPEHRAYFKFNCPYYECINGGFDLNNETKDMLRNNKNLISGKKICQGWQDQERINQHHCWCELTYKIEAYYKN